MAVIVKYIVTCARAFVIRKLESKSIPCTMFSHDSLMTICIKCTFTRNTFPLSSRENLNLKAQIACGQGSAFHLSLSPDVYCLHTVLWKVCKRFYVPLGYGERKEL